MDENGCIDIQWPSKRIAPGGLFHQPKVQYTPETQRMLKVLMEEAKLTLSQRKKMDWCLRSGNSLQDLPEEDSRSKSAQNNVPVRPKTSRRRSYSVIKNSGDLERETFKPTKRITDREIVKKHLQNIMEFGKDDDGEPRMVKLNPERLQKTKALPSKMDMLHELLTQIQEREEWLRDMEALGEGVKHREVISDQIAERVRKIEALNIVCVDENHAEESKNSVTSNRRPSRNETKKNAQTTTKRDVSSPAKNSPGNDVKTENFTPNSKDTGLAKKQISREDEIKMRQSKIDYLKKKIEKINRNNSTAEESIKGFSLEGSPCVTSERSARSKIQNTSSRVQNLTNRSNDN